MEVNCPKCSYKYKRNTIFNDPEHKCNLVEDIPLISEKVNDVLNEKNALLLNKDKHLYEKDDKIKSMEYECQLFKESQENKRKIIDFIMNPKDKVSCKLNPKAKIKFFGNGNC